MRPAKLCLNWQGRFACRGEGEGEGGVGTCANFRVRCSVIKRRCCLVDACCMLYEGNALRRMFVDRLSECLHKGSMI